MLRHTNNFSVLDLLATHDNKTTTSNRPDTLQYHALWVLHNTSSVTCPTEIAMSSTYHCLIERQHHSYQSSHGNHYLQWET